MMHHSCETLNIFTNSNNSNKNLIQKERKKKITKDLTTYNLLLMYLTMANLFIYEMFVKLFSLSPSLRNFQDKK